MSNRKRSKWERANQASKSTGNNTRFLRRLIAEFQRNSKKEK